MPLLTSKHIYTVLDIQQTLYIIHYRHVYTALLSSALLSTSLHSFSWLYVSLHTCIYICTHNCRQLCTALHTRIQSCIYLFYSWKYTNASQHSGVSAMNGFLLRSWFRSETNGKIIQCAFLKIFCRFKKKIFSEQLYTGLSKVNACQFNAALRGKPRFPRGGIILKYSFQL